jgi:DNA-directed RNA polymerase subunit RPC12/RpoP
VSAAVDEPLCSRCGQPVSGTATTEERGDQLAAERIECPNCGARLARDVEGHADRGWRIDEKPNG